MRHLAAALIVSTTLVCTTFLLMKHLTEQRAIMTSVTFGIVGILTACTMSIRDNKES